MNKHARTTNLITKLENGEHMKIDTIALILACIGFALWLTAMIGGFLAVGPFGFIILIPIAIGGYFLGMVISQRLKNREDDYYDKIER